MTRPGKKKFPNIFKEGRLGRLVTKNRVKYAACSVSNFNTRDGHLTEREFARMAVIAATGCGIITNQGAYPDPRGEGKGYYRQLAIYDDEFIPEFARVAELIHNSGAIAIQQILHTGRYGGIDLDYCVGASDVAQTLRHFRPPRAMSEQEIARCIEEHAAAARRAVAAGFDGVEVTSFMGYLLSNFLSGFTNTRTDRYGGSLANRARFMVELLHALRDAVGEQRPVLIRLNGEELMDEFGGNSIEDCMQIMKIAEDAGADCVSMVIGWHESRKGALGRDIPYDYWLYTAEEAKKHINIPIAFGPRLADPVLAEKALAEGKIDFWEVCRPMLADPEMLHKLSEDRADEIKPCTGGLVCLARMFRNLPYICTVNPRLGHEVEPAMEIKPAVYKKKVLVVGAGPAGLECATVAARRGHSVTIYERQPRIGGQLNQAMKEPEGGNAFIELVEHYSVLLKKYNVELVLETEVTTKLCRQFEPDVVIVATGAELGECRIPLTEGVEVLDAYAALDGESVEGKRVVVISGERLGLVTAEYLAKSGKSVTVIEQGRRVSSDVAPTFRWRHAAWLKEFAIESITGVKITAVENEGVRVVDPKGNKKLIEAEAIVLGGPRCSRQAFFREMDYSCDELYIVGDAVLPRSLNNAINEGYRIGVSI